MSENPRLGEVKSRRLTRFLLPIAVLAFGLVLGLVVGRWTGSSQKGAPEPTQQVEVAPSPQPSATPEPTCGAEGVPAALDETLSALENGEVARATAALDAALAAFAAVEGQPACGLLARDLLGVQALVMASSTWQAASQSRSVRQSEEADRLASQAAELAPAGSAQRLAAELLTVVREQRAELAAVTDPGRVVTDPATLATEKAGGLHPLCSVNALIKPILEDQSGDPLPPVSRMEVQSNTIYLLAGGRLMSAEVGRVLGPSPAVFAKEVDGEPGGVVVAGTGVGELVDLTLASNGDLLLLEKAGRLLRRTPAGVWTMERRAEAGELPVAVAPYTSRSYLLDPVRNQIWRYVPESSEEEYLPAYFQDGVVRDLGRAVDLAIDGAIYAARGDGRARRYYLGVEDPGFRPDTDLGVPAAIFLPDDPGSTLLYLVDGPGRRLLGLDRETGSYRLGFSVNAPDTGSLTSGAIQGGRLYLTDGKTLFVTILNPQPVAAADCPAFPYLPSDPFGQPELAELGLQLPVDATLPITLSLYPGGRWPEVGYGVLDGLAFVGLQVSDTIRAMAAGTVTRVVLEPAPVLDADRGVISTTRQVPAELNDAMWGRQVWIDHGNGIQTRLGGLAAVLPNVAEGQPVRRLMIIGFAGAEPVLAGIWVDGSYLGRGFLVPETMAAYRALFSPQ